MKVDIYKRQENSGKFSYLAVPHDAIIPQEVVNTDWLSAQRNVELREERDCLDDFLISDPVEQIAEKGYAITGVKEQDF